jgi:transposase
MENVLLPEIADVDNEDARTVTRKGAGRGRVEILGRERRRTWTPERKRAIVAEILGSELRPTEVARKYAISSGLLYPWRQQVLGGQVSVVTGATPSFARVELAPGLQAPDGSEPSAPAGFCACAITIVRSGWGDRDRAAEWHLGARCGWWSSAPCSQRARRSMIALSPGGRVYLACGITDMRKGAVGLAMLVQQSLLENPFDGSVYAFRRPLKLASLKPLRQQWPSANTTGRIALTLSQLAALLACRDRSRHARSV